MANNVHVSFWIDTKHRDDVNAKVEEIKWRTGLLKSRIFYNAIKFYYESDEWKKEN